MSKIIKTLGVPGVGHMVSCLFLCRLGLNSVRCNVTYCSDRYISCEQTCISTMYSRSQLNKILSALFKTLSPSGLLSTALSRAGLKSRFLLGHLRIYCQCACPTHLRICFFFQPSISCVWGEQNSFDTNLVGLIPFVLLLQLFHTLCHFFFF